MNLSAVRVAFRVVLLSLLVCFYNYSCKAQGRIPRFEDYPVKTIYRGKNAPLVLDKDARTFKTRLRNAATGRPNFAGHYIVTMWGCGTGCDVGAIIDARTGRVYWFPFPVGHDYEAGGEFNPVAFRLSSRLIIFSGFRVDTDEEAGARFYKFDNGRFKLLRFIKREASSQVNSRQLTPTDARPIKPLSIKHPEQNICKLQGSRQVRAMPAGKLYGFNTESFARGAARPIRRYGAVFGAHDVRRRNCG